MKEEKQISSGAKKAEKLADPTPNTHTENKEKPLQKAVKNQVNKGKKAVKKAVENTQNKTQKTARQVHKQVKQTAQKVQDRAEQKLKRAERKAQLLEKKLERKARQTQLRLEHKAERQKRRDTLRNEDKQARRDRLAQEKQARRQAQQDRRKARLDKQQARREHVLALKAERRAKHEQQRNYQLKKRAEQAQQRAERQRAKAPGFGGWLAATITLSVTTIALGSISAYSLVTQNGLRNDVADMQVGSLYELNSLVDNLDANLAKAKVSTSKADQTKIFSDIAIQSRSAETILERMPVTCQQTEKLTAFFNKMGDQAQNILLDIANGEKLSSSSRTAITYMYDTNLQLKRQLNDLTTTACPKDLLKAFDGKNGIMFDHFAEMENYVTETPKEIFDGPFAENTKQTSAKTLEGKDEISRQRAEQLAMQYFKSYSPKSAKCTGEATTKQLTCYNVEIATDDGVMMAQLAKNGGSVVLFDSYKDCTKHNFDVDRCTMIAQDFLGELGFKNVRPVWASENETTCNLNFVCQQDGVALYPDMIKVKVCEERGIVTGLEALAYTLNHTNRQLAKPTITVEQARKSVSFDVQKGGSLCLVPLEDQEVLAYQFVGVADGKTYYSYIDAKTGKEVQLFVVVSTKQGVSLL